MQRGGEGASATPAGAARRRRRGAERSGAQRGAARPAAGMAGKGRAPAGSGRRAPPPGPCGALGGGAAPPCPLSGGGCGRGQGFRRGSGGGGVGAPLLLLLLLFLFPTCSGPASGSPFLEERLRAGRKGKRCTPRPPRGGRRGALAGKRGAGSQAPSPRSLSLPRSWWLLAQPAWVSRRNALILRHKPAAEERSSSL